MTFFGDASSFHFLRRKEQNLRGSSCGETNKICDRSHPPISAAKLAKLATSFFNSYGQTCDVLSQVSLFCLPVRLSRLALAVTKPTLSILARYLPPAVGPSPSIPHAPPCPPAALRARVSTSSFASLAPRLLSVSALPPLRRPHALIFSSVGLWHRSVRVARGLSCLALLSQVSPSSAHVVSSRGGSAVVAPAVWLQRRQH